MHRPILVQIYVVKYFQVTPAQRGQNCLHGGKGGIGIQIGQLGKQGIEHPLFPMNDNIHVDIHIAGMADDGLHLIEQR